MSPNASGVAAWDARNTAVLLSQFRHFRSIQLALRPGVEWLSQYQPTGEIDRDSFSRSSRRVEHGPASPAKWPEIPLVMHRVMPPPAAVAPPDDVAGRIQSPERSARASEHGGISGNSSPPRPIIQGFFGPFCLGFDPGTHQMCRYPWRGAKFHIAVVASRTALETTSPLIAPHLTQTGGRGAASRMSAAGRIPSQNRQ
jgi:hypothetical protein